LSMQACRKKDQASDEGMNFLTLEKT